MIYDSGLQFPAAIGRLYESLTFETCVTWDILKLRTSALVHYYYRIYMTIYILSVKGKSGRQSNRMAVQVKRIPLSPSCYTEPNDKCSCPLYGKTTHLMTLFPSRSYLFPLCPRSSTTTEELNGENGYN